MKRLGLLLVGDEILAGHTRDSNGHWLAKRLKAMGVKLTRIEVCSDELEDVTDSVRRFLEDLGLDYVVTSGGLGPTHDDRTMEGIARAIGKPLAIRPEHEAWMRERVAEGHRRGYFDSPTPNAGLRKMAMLPEDSEALPNHLGTCLGAIVKAGNTLLFTLPGVPREFERMFDESVAPMLETAPAEHVEELIIPSEESRFFELLRDVEKEHGVAIGSYPQVGHIIVRATGPKKQARAAIEAIRQGAGLSR